jgi:flagellar biosynthesis/type III secretory pathway protein FliH
MQQLADKLREISNGTPFEGAFDNLAADSTEEFAESLLAIVIEWRDAGFNDGKEDGNAEGFEEGRFQGYNEGYNQGYSDGKAESNSDSYTEGYNDGIAVGRESGYLEAQIGDD